MTISLLAPALGRRLRRPAPAALLPMALPLADGAGLTVACLLTSAPGWAASGYACAVLVLLVADGQHRLRICRRVADQLPRTVAAAAAPLLLVLPWVGPSGGLALGLRCAAALAAARAGVCMVLKIVHRRGGATNPQWSSAPVPPQSGSHACCVTTRSSG